MVRMTEKVIQGSEKQHSQETCGGSKTGKCKRQGKVRAGRCGQPTEGHLVHQALRVEEAEHQNRRDKGIIMILIGKQTVKFGLLKNLLAAEWRIVSRMPK